MNILLLIFDDLRADLGHPDIPDHLVPNIRRLQARGTTFTNAHTPCAICAPARASLFTGQSPDTHGVTTLQHKLKGKLPDVLTWPAALKRRGWFTMRSGKVFHKGVPDCLVGLGDGDDDSDAWTVKHNPSGYELHSNGSYHNATPWETHTAGTGGAIAWLRAEKGDAKQHDYRMASDICHAIAQHDRSRPALWAAGFIRPHVPLVAPKAYFELTDKLAVDWPAPHPDATPIDPCVRDQWCGDWQLSDDDRRSAIRAYLACVAYADQQVGRILDELDASGMADDTLVILTADHGFQLGEHGLWFKNFLYRESTHTPLIIADPRRPDSHGATRDLLVDQTDLWPTVFELIDIAAPEQQPQGYSLVPAIEGDDRPVRQGHRAQVDWGPTQGRSVRTHDWLYVQWTGGHEGEALYDLHEDPGEEVNLLAEGKSHAMTATLRGILHGD